MEGGQKISINLEAGLNINTSDMLTPLASQVFQHNWQKFQGKFLPNSLRFEKNGWAAGWNVYNFNYSVFRKQLAENLYAELGSFNTYTKMLSLYDSESSVKSLADYYVVPESLILSGDALINGNKITGSLNNKPYALTWDPVTHTVSCDTTGFSVKSVINVDKSVTMTVSDDSSSFAMDFDLQLASSLVGDALEEVAYSGYENDKHSWSAYTYDTVTGNIVTPEGVTVPVAVDDGNRIKFDYTKTVTDETLDINYSLEKYYTRFNNITCKDQTNEVMTVGSAASQNLAFDRYLASVKPNALISKDEDGVIIDMTLPIWATCGFKVKRSNPNAKYCDNCKNFEVAVHVGTGLLTRVSYTSIFDNVTKDEDLVDNYRRSTSKHRYPQYIKDMNYRFNQILVGNTIEKGTGWNPNKVKLVTSNIWPLSTRQYPALKSKRTAQMTKYLGDVYTWGSYTFKASDYIEINNPWDWTNKNNVVYTEAEISDILSVKKKGTVDNVNIGSDEQFIKDLLPTPEEQLEKYIAKFTGTVIEYTEHQAAKAFNELYASGKYIGGTYETVGVSTEEETLWPFEKVPKFNYIKTPETYSVVTPTGTENPVAEGWYELVGGVYELSVSTSVVPDKTYYKHNPAEIIEGVYWTNGVNVITDFEDFKVKVLGEYDSDTDANNSLVTENTSYSRKRVVKQYRATYDFKFIRESDFEDQEDYQTAKYNFNKVWAKYYPSIQSPLDTFDDTATLNDTSYLAYEDIDIINNVEPYISYVQPGVYILGNKSVPYDASSGLIVYDDTEKYTLTPFICHHAVNVLNDYIYKHTLHEEGHIKCDGYRSAALPFYFGSATTQSLDEGQENTSKFLSRRVSSTLESAALTIGVNYDYEQRYIAGAGGSLGYNYYIWVPRTPDAKHWFGNVLLKYKQGVVTVEAASLNNNVEGLQSYYVAGDINDGIKFGWPIKGHTATRLVYPEMLPQLKISDDDAFVLIKVDTADLANKNLVYVDRDDVDKGQLLFNIIKNSAQPDDSQGKGNFCVQPEAVGDAFLWYAKKQVNAEQKEIYSPYYLPGIVYGNVESSEGNMVKVEHYPILKLIWVPEVLKMPTSAYIKFSNNKTFVSKHSFYSKAYSLLNCTVTLGDFDAIQSRLPIYIDVGANRYELYYDAKNHTTEVVSGDTVFVDDSAEKVTAVGVTGKDALATVNLNIDLIFNNNTGRFYSITDNNYTLTEAEQYKVTVHKGTVDLVYDINGKKIISPKADIKVTTVSDTVQNIKAEGSVQTVITAMLKSVFDGSISGSVITFKYKEQEYTFDMSEVQSKNTGISVLSTDIRKADDTKVIGLLRQEGQYQLLRQQWNTTVEVENYWWIDAKHILELNKYSFVLKRNTEELDDWNGNRFEKVGEISRDKVLPSDIIRYYVTNMYNSSRSALIMTLQIELGQIVIKLIDPRERFTEYAQVKVQVRVHDIDTDLNDKSVENNIAYFNTYNPLTSDQILSKAEWTNTIVDDTLIIGCHLSNNIDQWAIVYDITNKTILYVIQGYGYVGLHGELTGGQVPSDFFDETRGLNTKVQPLTILVKTSKNLDDDDLDAAYEVGDITKLNDIETCIVGTSEQQWYIAQRVYGIVSHLTFNNTTKKFEKQLIPITNNYAAVYKSPSFASAIMGDAMVAVQSFNTMFHFTSAAKVAWNTIMSFCGMPMMYYLAPRYSTLAYLQQTFGQYAYVHYNNSKSIPEQEIGNSKTDSGINEAKNKQTDAILSNSFTFDKQKFSQRARTQMSFHGSGIMSIIFSAMSAGLEYIDTKMSLNEDQNQTATTDIGKKFLDNAVANVGDMAAASIMTQSKCNSGLTSVVTGIKSLDMFYSTSDQQRVYAGPGYVEHQFVADCIAQSVTDVQVEGKVQTLFFCIRALTTMQMNIEIKLKELTAEALDKAADATAAQMICGTSLGAVAVGIHAAAAVLRASIAAQQIAMVEIDKILDVICENGITVNVDGVVSKHALNVEGKHKYGEKNEVFLWPCWGVTAGQLKYTDEYVDAGVRNTPWQLNLKSRVFFRDGKFNMVNLITSIDIPEYSSNQATESDMLSNTGFEDRPYNKKNRNEDSKGGDNYRAYFHEGGVTFYQASAIGKAEERTLPDDMAKIEGVVRFLPNEPFKNENIGQSDPVFAPSMIHDYIIDKTWDLSQCCSYGLQQWVAVKDTKVIDCPPSNIVITGNFCGVACPYTAVEVKRGIQKAYMRPWAITPSTLALNCTGFNTIFDNKLYHAFDGISYRLVDLVGSPGMNKNRQSFWYALQVNDRFKRSNIIPANEMQGNFESEPVQAAATIDKMWTTMTIASKEKGMEAGTVGEDKDLIRWAIPVFTEQVSTLPAAVKTMSAMTLGVVEGVTSLCVDLANNQSAYKAPLSVDFTIGKNVYRATEEYICSVQTQNGIDIVTDLIPSLGLKYIGSTPTEAYFYSKSTRCYYTFTGSSLTKMDMMERFRDIQKGYWDFVNQEVVMPCLMTFKRLNAEVEDKDTETDNIIIPVLSKNQVSGELPPPITTIFNDRSWYKCVSLPCGFAYQGPNRVIINRAIFCEYMERSIKDNYNKWKKMDKEKYVTHREYLEKYDNIMRDVKGVDGWTYNPFVLVTSALGQSEDTDCIFEWNITFCWPIEMDLLYSTDKYAVVNIVAETMTPGGKVITRPTHVYLTKEYFTRSGNYGYYSFRYQSKNGMGNRERLHIWSDQYIAISSIDCECKVETSRRNEQLTQQVDVAKLKEL